MSSLPRSYLSRFYNGDITSDELIRKGCLNLKRLNVRPAQSLSYLPLYVDCGKCLNCVANRRSEWVSRMCLHSLYFKHCYFVTLTYGTFDISKYDSHPFSRMWLETLPVYSDYNLDYIKLPTPSLIVKSHASKFIKRLRLLLDSPISFVYSGEYGEDYGRPHFHFIIWSDSIITRDQVCSAWSLKCVFDPSNSRIVKSYRGQDCDPSLRFDFLIGHVKFYDLVANGSLDFSSVSPNCQVSAPRCFNYVASYVTKYNSDSIPLIARKKLISVFNILPPSDYYVDDNPDYGKFHKKLVYENVEYESVTLEEFLRLVAPCFNFSRGEAIGKRYFVENFSRFEKGEFSLPDFCGKKLSFPRYYFYLLSIQRQPYRLEKVTFLSRSYIKGNFHILLENLKLFRDDPFLFISQASRKVPQLESFYSSSLNGNILDAVLLQDFKRYHISYSPTFDVFEFHIFNRHNRFYEFAFYIERVDFLDFLIDKLSKEIKDFNQLSWDNQVALDNLRSDLINKNPDVVSDFLDSFRHRQSMYRAHHTSKDSQ